MSGSTSAAQYAIRTSNLYMAVTINGTQYPIVPRQGVQFMVMDNVKNKMASYMLVLDDVGQQLANSVAITDGTPIQVAVGTDISSANTYNFRAYGKPAKRKSDQVPGANMYIIQGVSSAIAMITARPPAPVVGNSSAVVNKAASQFGLSVKSNFNSNDSMTWLPSNMPWIEFLAHTVEHAWEDANSVASHYIDALDNLHFWNVGKLYMGSNVKAYIYNNAMAYNQTPAYPCTYFKNISRAGEQNHVAVYGAQTIQPQSTGSVTSHSNVSTSLITQVIDTSKDIKSLITDVPKLLFAPTDCGNNHASYIAARHQNFRLNALFNQDIYVGLVQFSGLGVYEPVLFSSTDSTGNIEQDVTGRYIVSAINRFVSGGFYYEKLELTSSGIYLPNTSLV